MERILRFAFMGSCEHKLLDSTKREEAVNELEAVQEISTLNSPRDVFFRTDCFSARTGLTHNQTGV